MLNPLRTYNAYYNNQTREIMASSIWDAKQAAVAYFKPTKSKRHMVSVVLADVPLDPASLG